MKKTIILLLFLPIIGFAQLPSIYENESFRPYDRYVYSVDSFHTSVRPYLMNQVDPIVKIDSLFSIKTNSKVLNYIMNKHLVRIQKNDIWLTLDPFINFETAKSNGYSGTSWINTRGFILNGAITKQLAFTSTFRENQAMFNDYRNDIINNLQQIPGQGLVKRFKMTGKDWGYVSAVASFSPSKHFNLQLGNDRNFLGDGYRSLLLSDNTQAYPFFKITTDFWKVKYVNIWGQFTDYRPTQSNYDNIGYRKKWAAIQYVSWNATKWLNISAFESVMWANSDSIGYRGFDFSYANPVIFLRPVEFANGSPDNVMMGASGKITLKKKYIFYGQALIDEFNLKEMKANTGYWANKYGYQMGAKTFDLFGLKHFDIQGEYNRVRPFTYSHWNTLQVYGNVNQPLGDPFGANFQELIGIAHYNWNRIFLNFKLVYAKTGESMPKFNAGENIFTSYLKEYQMYGNYIGQGTPKTLRQTDISLSYMINPMYNLNVSAGITDRNLIVGPTLKHNVLIYFTLRSSLDNMFFDY